MNSVVWGNLIGIVTVLTMATFLGIWVWAWGKRHRKVFKRMSEIPMEDPPEGPVPPAPAAGDEPTRAAPVLRSADASANIDSKQDRQP